MLGGELNSSVKVAFELMMRTVTALYTLTFGVLGFIPPPKNAPVRKQQ